MNGGSEQAPGRHFDNIGERDVFIFFLEKIWQRMAEMDIQITSLERDVNFPCSKQEAVYLEKDTFLMQ